MQTMEQISKELLEALWQLDPVQATNLGVSGFEGMLPPVNPDLRQELCARISRLAGQLKELLESGVLSASEILDAEVAIANIEAKMAQEPRKEDWRANPNWYVSQVNNGLNGLLTKDWESTEHQVEAIRRMVEAVPGFVEDARRNLIVSSIPKEWIDVALQAISGHQRLLKNSIQPFVQDAVGYNRAFDQLCQASIRAMGEFGRYLEDIRPRATGSFACGRSYFERVLQQVHMVDMDAEELREFGLQKIQEYESALEAAAKSIDADKHWTQLIAEFKEDHPTPDTLLDSYFNEGRLAEEFVREKDLITIPEGQTWAVEPVPEYSRATHPLGYMRTSPPFAPGYHSVLHITPIDPNASPERQKQHLRDNCYAFQRTIAFHELIPGHHLQACLAKIGVSDLRKNFRSTVFVEGWGLYTEVLMAEQGYLDEPATTLINLRNALWRAVRVVVDVGLHAGGMSLEEATRLLQEKVRMEHHMASGEATRYTFSPTYQSSYLLGKEQILKLRSEYQQKLGEKFTLKAFHDKLTSYGSIPVALVRREMLAER